MEYGFLVMFVFHNYRFNDIRDCMYERTMGSRQKLPQARKILQTNIHRYVRVRVSTLSVLTFSVRSHFSSFAVVIPISFLNSFSFLNMLLSFSLFLLLFRSVGFTRMQRIFTRINKNILC